MNRKENRQEEGCPEARERRGFFRISDDLILTYQPVPREIYEARSDKSSNSEPSGFNLKARFAALDRALRPVMHRLEDGSPDLARCLQTINEKLDLLADVLFRREVDLRNLPSQEVNLSAGGMSFRVQRPLQPDTILQVRLLLEPSGIGIEAFARVVYCRQERRFDNPRYPWRVGVEFLHLREEDSDLIIRHVLCRDADRRRQEGGGTVSG